MLRQDMGPFREREWIVRVPFVGIRTFAVSRIPPDNIRHLLAPDTNSETEDEDYEHDFETKSSIYSSRYVSTLQLDRSGKNSPI